jgi:hypothetical protein
MDNVGIRNGMSWFFENASGFLEIEKGEYGHSPLAICPCRAR